MMHRCLKEPSSTASTLKPAHDADFGIADTYDEQFVLNDLTYTDNPAAYMERAQATPNPARGGINAASESFFTYYYCSYISKHSTRLV